MKILLKKDVHKLGSLGDEIEVKDGFARNFLIPTNQAVAINQENRRRINFQKKLLAEKRSESIAANQSLAEKIAGCELSFVMKASKEGRLFGSVNASQIEEALAEQNIKLGPKIIPEKLHIKQLGEHEILLKLHSEVQATLKFKVLPEDPPEKETEAELSPPLASDEKEPPETSSE